MENTFLKWAGGKNWFISQQNHRLPAHYNRYIDPFLGGGSVFFYLEPEEAILSDVNGELITTYRAIQQDWRKLERKLRCHAHRHSNEYYYRVRAQRPREMTSIAARMIYLNRTCFNGIYRVNRQGDFNVPRGSKDTVITGLEEFEQRSRLLQHADLIHCDFENTINMAAEGDFLFCDPPYAVQEGQSFVGYTQNLFNWDDQVRLADALERARQRGVQILMTKDEELRTFFEKHSAYQSPWGHHDLYAIINACFHEAYDSNVVNTDYGQIVEDGKLSDRDLIQPTKEWLDTLTEKQILAVIAWHFRRDHFSEGSWIADSVADGHMAVLVDALLGRYE